MNQISGSSARKPVRRAIHVSLAAPFLLVIWWAVVFLLRPTIDSAVGPIDVFVWSDMAFVWLVGAMPIAVMLCEATTRKLPPAMLWPTVLIALMMLVVIALSPYSVPETVRRSTRQIILVRAGLSLAVVYSACVAGAGLPLRTVRFRIPQPSWPVLCVLIGAWVIVPETYTRSRCDHYRQRLADLLAQYRLGETAELASKLTQVSPVVTVNGQPIGKMLHALQTEIRTIRRSLDVGHLPAESLDIRIDFARRLAILGRRQEVRELLKPLNTARPADPRSYNTIATIHETCEDWRQGLMWYTRSSDHWEQLDETEPGRGSGLTVALKGIAYCQRKLGRVMRASVAYERVLELSPTAETHFLLAQFFEDCQHATRAHKHVRQAMLLDLERFRTPGERMLDRLLTSHFGCISVYRRESERR